MKRNRESKCRIRIINFQHRNKQGQKDLDDLVRNYGFTYYQLYQLIFKGVYVRTNLFEIVNDLINSQVNPRLRWDSFLDNILPIDTSYYIDVDLGRCRDIPVIQEIHLKKDGDTYKMVD